MSAVDAAAMMGSASTPSDDSGSSNASSTASVQTAKPEPVQPAAAPFPPPKTDKPRPHICTTCNRAFARLEHLKRHERSHTKEKPFECPQCTRCFARRDLLLRHQQKLHQQGATAARPRNARRESTTGLPPNLTGRVRKNSVSGGVAVTASMRPRANTISHIDPSAFTSFLASHNAALGRGTGHLGPSQHAPMSGIGGPNLYDYRAISGPVSNVGTHGLPRLDTHIGLGLGGGLRTAPIQGVGPDDLELEKFFGASAGSTINPNQLHHFNSAMGNQQASFRHFANPFAANNSIEEDGLAWSAGFDNSLMFSTGNDTAIDGSSPSAISTASQGFSEVMVDGSGQPTTANMWHNPMVTQSSAVNPPTYSLDAMGPVFQELMMDGVISQDLGEHAAQNELYMSAGPVLSPSAGIPGMPNQYFQAPLNFSSDSGSISSSSVNGSARHSSVTSLSTESITDATRQALVMNLSQALNASPHQRKFSQPHISSPLSQDSGNKPQIQVVLPSTQDLQRFVNAYIQYFHPHLPFLHIPTLSFDNPPYTHHLRAKPNVRRDSIVGGGGGCLILAMAAIGALYEFEQNIAKELFDHAKKMILYYLDEQRRAGLAAAVTSPSQSSDTRAKPALWLIQAMLLNLVFGHNCGDRQAAEVASTHCAALVSLAKAAGLDRPTSAAPLSQGSVPRQPGEDAEKTDESSIFHSSQIDAVDEHAQWIQWKKVEERKRTYFAIFSMSSILVSAYAHAPRILNSEIRLELPCEEDLWAIDNAQAWVAMGGPTTAQSKGLHFNTAVGYLLDASTRQENTRLNNAFNQSRGNEHPMTGIVETKIRPSTFGCYVLINALHVYIWETRQRHTGHLWRAQETEEMSSQIEPALKAWQAAWAANPKHTLDRTSLYGPLAADCIPLLDLAYVRLSVNLNRAKELLWQRDFDGMCNELARGVDIVAHADPAEQMSTLGLNPTPPGYEAAGLTGNPSVDLTQGGLTSKRERQLRKAACYAADSLTISGQTTAELTAKELPNSSALCAFDCAQVLAEWIATVQDRVGPHLGILGKDEIDFTAVPAVMLLEDEDTKLLQQVADMLHNAELTLAYELSTNVAPVPMLASVPNPNHQGFAARVLLTTAHMLKRNSVWPITNIQAHALQTHANHITQRAGNSVNLV